MPKRATWLAGEPAISRPRNWIDPLLGASAPAIRLKVVLLPDPFGPIKPRISPSATSKETRSTALKPPKTLVIPLTLSMGLELARAYALEKAESGPRPE